MKYKNMYIKGLAIQFKLGKTYTLHQSTKISNTGLLVALSRLKLGTSKEEKKSRTCGTIFFRLNQEYTVVSKLQDC